jgi:hypothetical protein
LELGVRKMETEAPLPELGEGKEEKSHQSLENQLQRSEIFVEIVKYSKIVRGKAMKKAR